MKRKITALILVLAFALCLFCACDDSGADTNVDAEQSYHFIYKGVEIVPGAEMEPVKNALGEPTSYYESVSCAFEGMDKIYTYGSVQITTYTEKEVDYIYTIVLLDDGVATPEGLYIGADTASLINAYGDVGVNQSVAIYTRGNSSITVGLRNGVVVSITYTAIN